MHLDGSVFNRHLGHLRNEAAEGFMHGHATCAPLFQRAAPAGFFRHQVQHAQVPRMLGQQAAPVIQRILARGMRKLVDQAFHREGRVAVADRAPPQHRNSGFG